MLALISCRQDMHDQPRGKPLAVSGFFADGKLAREPVPGTVPHGYGLRDTPFYTGRRADLPTVIRSAEAPPVDSTDREQIAAWRALSAAAAVDADAVPNESAYIDVSPVALTPQLLLRGQQRYDIYCAVCHDRAGSGDGLVVRKGFSRPPSFHSERLVRARLGHFFEVMSNGFGAMPAYGSLVPPADRWAIAAYIRALQLSQRARPADVPESERRALCKSAESGKEGPP